MAHEKDSILVIGAGAGGLAAGIRLAAAGLPVTLVEAHGWPGGKMRVTPSPAGPVDAGPTVLTMRAVLEDLFAASGAALEAHLDLTPLPVLARHYWRCGARLDLVADPGANAEAIGAAFGARARDEFLRFDRSTRALFAAFAEPVMEAARPSVFGATRAALAAPRVLPWLRPGLSLQAALARSFTDPRLRQLFGRYATYVGGNPQAAPALLALIWQAEAAGVWTVKGGMARLAEVLAARFTALGGDLRLESPVARLTTSGGAVTGAELACGTRIAARHVVFNGDPAALPALMGRAVLGARATRPRSLSAHVWTGAGEVGAAGLGRDALAYHTVFFADDAAREFGPLARGEVPEDPTIYLCAQDRASATPAGLERFQFILNAPALDARGQPKDMTCDMPRCKTDPFARLKSFGLHLHAQAPVLTAPGQFAQLFPASQGALYGRSPDSAMASFLRPTARTRVAGLYLAGGGVHPGAGVPMALLSGKHAATAVLSDRISAPMSRPMAMPGGISTGSAMTGTAPSR